MAQELKIATNVSLLNLLGKSDLLVPDYQRDYAQGRIDDGSVDEIRKDFISDLLASLMTDNICHLGLVYGSRPENKDGFVAVDGQQRLTTLFLLHWYLAKRCLNKVSSDRILDFLSKMSWDSRVYTSEFVQFLLETELYDIHQDHSLSYLINTKPYFYPTWITDPSVENMLVTLDEIDRQFKLLNLAEENISALCDKLLGECPIMFDILPLEDGSDEVLYIKMNSRGRNLTTFENFKAKLHDTVFKENSALQKKMDKEWLSFMETLSASDDGAFVEPDVSYMNYFNEVSLYLALSSPDYQRKTDFITLINDSKLQKNDIRKDVKYIPFGYYEELLKDTDNVLEFQKITEWLIANKDCCSCVFMELAYDEENDISRLYKSIVGNSVTYLQRVVFYSSIRFAQITKFEELEQNKSQFKNWIRVFHNLESATGTDSPKDLCLAVEALAVNKEGYLIEDILNRDNSLKYFNGEQQKEEKLKIKAFSCEEYANKIIGWERKKYFQGIIRLLNFYECDTLLSLENFTRLEEWFSYLFENKYKQNDFDFWRAMVSMIPLKEPYYPNKKQFTILNENTQGNIITRWFHDLLNYLLKGKYSSQESDKEKLWLLFLKDRFEEWNTEYDGLDYNGKKKFKWIDSFINEDRVKDYYSSSETKRIIRHDWLGVKTLWMYRKTYFTYHDNLISNYRHEVVKKYEPSAPTDTWLIDIIRENKIRIRFTLTTIEFWILDVTGEKRLFDFEIKKENDDIFYPEPEETVSQMTERIIKQINNNMNLIKEKVLTKSEIPD